MGAAPCGPVSGGRVLRDKPWQGAGFSELDFSDAYETGALLGVGTFGQVRVCWPSKAAETGALLGVTSRAPSEGTSQRLAVKIVDAHGEAFQDSAQLLCARGEASILRSLTHPNIVELVDAFGHGRWLFLVTECIEGGELFRSISNPKLAVTEGCIAVVGRQLLLALQHLEERQVVHRDVKAENIILASDPAKGDGSWCAKLIDFGLAMRMEQPTAFFGTCSVHEVRPEDLLCGTGYYCAPEVWAGDYGPHTDIWAAGVVLYLALLGTFPFCSRDPEGLEAKICSPCSEPSFQPAGQKECKGYQVSESARACLTALLTRDVDERPAAEQALELPWLLVDERACDEDDDLPDVLPVPLGKGQFQLLDDEDQVVPAALRARAGKVATSPDPYDALKEMSPCAPPCLQKQMALDLRSDDDDGQPRWPSGPSMNQAQANGRGPAKQVPVPVSPVQPRFQAAGLPQLGMPASTKPPPGLPPQHPSFGGQRRPGRVGGA